MIFEWHPRHKQSFMIHHLMNWKSSKEFRSQKAWGVEGRANMGVQYETCLR